MRSPTHRLLPALALTLALEHVPVPVLMRVHGVD
jgi:hypothetical protein